MGTNTTLPTNEVMPLGRKFEEAVYAFAKTLDPTAEVLFDHDVPDRDTGGPRQCDVWINAKFGGHWPLSILVSCKDDEKSGRKLDVGDMGTFCDEIRSTGATMGVIYSNIGFTKPALKKAQANHIVCCRLYRDEPAELPNFVWFEQYTCQASIALILKTDVSGDGPITWNDLFEIQIDHDNGYVTLLDSIAARFAEDENEAIQKISMGNPFPRDWGTEIVLGQGTDEELRIQVWGHWKWYRARSEAILLNGSYCLSDGSFKGTQRGPGIDMYGADPGPSWAEITEPNFTPGASRITAIRCGGDVRAALRQSYGPQSVYSQEATSW